MDDKQTRVKGFTPEDVVCYVAANCSIKKVYHMTEHYNSSHSSQDLSDTSLGIFTNDFDDEEEIYPPTIAEIAKLRVRKTYIADILVIRLRMIS